jgi:hypothetical protein
MTLGSELGPLAALQGEWEGAEGLDVAFSNVRGVIADTPFRERTTFSPFGPVENGTQVLYGLDYRTAAWRDGEENPFHTEVGYWLWDAADGQVMRCFMVPRGTLVLAGGSAAAGDKVIHMSAEVGSETYGILSNRVLASMARTIGYTLTLAIGDGTFSYDESTTIEHARQPNPIVHTDRNTLHRVGDAGPQGEVSLHGPD